MPKTDMQQRMNKLLALRESYHVGLPARMTQIELAWESLLKGDKTAYTRQTLHHLVHGLAGSAGTFGYINISERARELEHVIESIVDILSHPPRDIMILIDTRIKALKRAITTDTPIDIADIPNYISENSNTPIKTEIEIIDLSNTVFMIDSNASLAQESAAQLKAYGWDTRIFTTIQEAEAVWKVNTPAAIVIDILSTEGRLMNLELIHHMKADNPTHHIPTIVNSVRWDWESRLLAARAGIDAYLVKPVDFASLAECLDRLTRKNADTPYRVLIIEDERILAQHYAEILTMAGMNVRTVLDPIHILDTLDDFEPELILLDLYMPKCNGIEIARVIRQDPKLTDIPIVFLSTESGRMLQMTAMNTGGDDFLQKPIKNLELVSSVTLRASRFRALRQLIRQDSMTGLLNHIAFKLQLDVEVSRHQRSNTVMSVVMVDLDNFKQINETYGHPMGDRIIKSLANLLRKRLRKTDIIGRYGGEELAIIMADTAIEEAINVMDSLREQFSQIRHVNDVWECNCTFSAGVASFPNYTGMTDIILAADLALYNAKQQGRNKVCR